MTICYVVKTNFVLSTVPFMEFYVFNIQVLTFIVWHVLHQNICPMNYELYTCSVTNETAWRTCIFNWCDNYKMLVCLPRFSLTLLYKDVF